MNVVVTGATGFIGSYLVPILLNKGHNVIVISNRSEYPSCNGVVSVKADLLDPLQCAKAMETSEADCLIHLAWYAEHGKFWSAQENFIWAAATANLLTCFAANGGRRAILTGTCAEYDWSNGYCVEGVTPTVPATIYGKCKDATRQYVEDYCARKNIDFVWARVFTPFGPGEPENRFLPSVLRAMILGETVRISHGRQFRDFLHVSDVASALAHLAFASNTVGVFNISSGQPIQLSDLVEICASLFFQKPKIEFGAVSVSNFDPLMLVGCALKLEATGWRAKTTILDGLIDYRNKYLATIGEKNGTTEAI